MAQLVKNPPAMQETRLWSLGKEDPLEKEMTTHSKILAWTALMDRGAWRATVHGLTKNWPQLSHQHTHTWQFSVKVEFRTNENGEA